MIDNKIMSKELKDMVEQAYDSIAERYFEWVQDQRSPRERYTDKVLENSLVSPCILELGCGSGVPITRMLLDRGAQVIANDISTKQTSMAKEKCPQATFIPGDMVALSFEPASFDGVTCFYAIFHLPRAEQKKMLSQIHSWLKPGGLFAFNLATIDKEEVHGEMFGHRMFWSSYSVEDSKAMVMDVGFEIVEAEVLEAGDGVLKEGDLDYGVKFIWLAARKRSSG